MFTGHRIQGTVLPSPKRQGTEEPSPVSIIEKPDIKDIFKARDKDANKGDFGYIALIGGSKEYSGASKLANMAAAAMRAGSGVVKLAVPDSIAFAVMPYILESTLYPMPDNDGHIVFDKESLDKCIAGTKSVAVGMGIGRSDEVKKTIEYLLRNYQGVLIIDADGLNMLAELCSDETKKSLLIDSKAKIVLTPHLKEFSRLTGLTIEDIKVSPEKYAKEFASRNKCILLLKGSTTVVTDGDKVYLVKRGCPGMATAGSGDVLSGILAAICGYNIENVLMAVAAGAYINGVAGELAQAEYGDISMLAGDTVGKLPAAIAEVR